MAAAAAKLIERVIAEGTDGYHNWRLPLLLPESKEVDALRGSGEEERKMYSKICRLLVTLAAGWSARCFDRVRCTIPC